MTLTLTLDRVILHTTMHHSSTSTYKPSFIEIEEKVLWTDGRTYMYGRTYVRIYGQTFETDFIGSTLLKSQPNKLTCII